MNSFMQNTLSSTQGRFLMSKLNTDYSEEWGFVI